jgi:anti-sigma factor RsiW
MNRDLPGGVSDEDLSSYLDGGLEPLRRAQVEAAIRADPHLTRTIAAYRAQEDDLREMAASVLEEPVPEHLLGVVRKARRPSWRPPLRQVMQIAAALVVGVALGWLLQTSLQPSDDNLLEPFIRQAVLSHELFEANEELDTLRESEARMLQEVRSPFRTPIRIPQLLGANYRPVLFRSVEGVVGPGVELAYADAEGALTSLLIRQHSDRDDIPVRFRKVDSRSVLYWLDGPLLYVLVGVGGEDELRGMARSVYAATASGGGWQNQTEQALPPAASSSQ